MKSAIIKIRFVAVLCLSVISISCGQKKPQKTTHQDLSTEVGNRYYYTNYYCYDFVKQCELEMLKLIRFDTMMYVSSSQFHGKYHEIHGKLTRINDSIFFVQPFKQIIQNGNGAKPHFVHKDSISFYCDSSLIGSNLKIEYINGKKEEYKISSTKNIFWINNDYFNKDNPKIYLSFDYKNPIIDETVEIVSTFSEKKYDVFFGSDQLQDNFYIVVDNEHVKTLNIGNEAHQCFGPNFKLSRMASHTLLPGNRKLYD